MTQSPMPFDQTGPFICTTTSESTHLLVWHRRVTSPLFLPSSEVPSHLLKMPEARLPRAAWAVGQQIQAAAVDINKRNTTTLQLPFDPKHPHAVLLQ